MSETAKKSSFLFPAVSRLELALWAIFFVAWIASTTELRVDAADAGVPLWVTGSAPSFLAAITSTFLIEGTQGTPAIGAAVLAAVITAMAEIPPLVFTNGVADTNDVVAAGAGGLIGFVLLACVRKVFGSVRIQRETSP